MGFFLDYSCTSLNLSQILGTSINSSGSGAPLHAPYAAAQQQCIRDAFADAGRDPAEVDFVELHATGSYFLRKYACARVDLQFKAPLLGIRLKPTQLVNCLRGRPILW
jgi:3-oxoacyl-(acyl-carrier-protein) synthase